ncbi:lipase family protein [Dokdonella fugitiva]|uniref:Lipase (Class 3) n=1 Tax=Dokdonella fugitiva TaxID=328517 RepID=A0A4R2IBE2_9GAMM|nr:lipase family protein [Dokdonella fugitiva]TCO40758.1 lipase (class 3) [Dokdonella fugitiva]
MATQPTKSPPMYFPPTFNLGEAAICASLVLTAYDQFNQWQAQGYPSQSRFQWTPKGLPLNYGASLWANVTVLGVAWPEPFGFVAWDGAGNAFIALRGTMTKADAVIDAEVDQTPYTLAAGFGNVQVGWNDVYAALSPALLGQLGQIGAVSRLYFTGHSMGAALSTLAVPDVATNSAIKPAAGRSYVHYNFASPRVGDPGFAAGTNWGIAVPTFRIVNTEDIVPDVPPPLLGSTVYQHVGTPVDFTAEYLTTDGNHSMADCYWYAINHVGQPQGPVSGSLAMNRLVRVDGGVTDYAPLQQSS